MAKKIAAIFALWLLGAGMCAPACVADESSPTARTLVVLAHHLRFKLAQTEPLDAAGWAALLAVELRGADRFVLLHAPIGPAGNALLVARCAALAGLPLVVTGPVVDAS